MYLLQAFGHEATGAKEGTEGTEKKDCKPPASTPLAW